MGPRNKLQCICEDQSPGKAAAEGEAMVYGGLIGRFGREPYGAEAPIAVLRGIAKVTGSQVSPRGLVRCPRYLKS